MTVVAEIIPALKLPRRLNYFDYSVPEFLLAKVKIGSVVHITVRNRLCYGLVRQLKQKEQSEKINLKPVLAVRDDLSLSPKQINLITAFAHDFYYSLGSTAKLFLPPILKRPLRPSAKTTKPRPEIIPTKDTSATAAIAQTIVNSSGIKYLLIPNDQSRKTRLFLTLAELTAARDKQILILFPEVEKASRFYNSLPEELKNIAVLITNEFFKGKNYRSQVWLDINGNSRRIVIGTRMAIFMPLAQVGNIIIDEADSEDYKQYDQNPRYDVNSFVELMAEQFDANLIYSSITPPVEIVYKAKKENYQYINIGDPALYAVDVINLIIVKKKEQTFIAQKVMDDLATTIENKQSALLIVNRQGEHNYHYCAECGFGLSCATCGLPLSSTPENKLYCRQCKTKTDFDPCCSRCGSFKMKTSGTGIEAFRKVLKKEFTNTLLLDKETPTSVKTDLPTIYLSTGQYFNVDFANLNVKYLAFLYYDGFLATNDFSAALRTATEIRNIAHAVFAGKPASFIIQTHFPEQPIFQNLSSLNKLYDDEFKARELFGYPPFQTILKLIYRNKDQANCQSVANDLYRRLNLKYATSLKLIPPYPAAKPKVRNEYQYVLPVFLPLNAKELENQLNQEIPEDWIIDRNPLNML